MFAAILCNEALTHILASGIVAERPRLVPVVVRILGSVEDPGGADVEQRDIEFVRDVDRIFDRQRVGRIRLFGMLLAKFEAGVSTEVE